MGPLGPIRGIILDVDGTLLDSNDAHARAWSDVFGAFGFDVPYGRVRPLIGMGGDQILSRLVGLADEKAPGKDIARERQQLFRQHYLQSVRATRGARDLVLALKRRGLSLVIATSSGADEVDALLAQAGVLDLFPAGDGAKTNKDDVESSKPAPDVVEAALEKLRLPASEVLMVGDTRYDVEAAGRAGVRTVALRCGGAADGELEGAWAILDDPAALVRRLDDVLAGSPPEAIASA
jgi:HAD superfamily hydrolase (TIGR01509 family)